VGPGNRFIPSDFASIGQSQNRGRPRGDHDGEGALALRSGFARRGASNIAKYAAAEAAVNAVDHTIQIHGGNGISAEYGLLPQWGLARLLRIAPVSREMVLNYVAPHSLSLPRSY
jgi:alkylation response protein AidB-like acyl-CoA dehydrogenase